MNDALRSAGHLPCPTCNDAGRIELALLRTLGDESPYIRCPDCGRDGQGVKALQADAAAILDDLTAPYPDDAVPVDPYELIIFLVEKYGHARVSGSCLGIKSADWHRRIEKELRRLFAEATS